MRSGVTSVLRAIIAGGTVTGLTDGQLLERFSAHRGEEAEPAFTALVMRHGPLVFGVCQSLLRNPHDAEDAFQATFLVLARKAGSLRQPDLLGPWLHGVAHRTARRLKDKNARRKRHEAEAAMSGPRPSSNPNRHQSGQANCDEIEALHQEIERLPQRYRTAIVLCDLQGLTHEEAARRLGRRVGTISSQLSRARERLRIRLVRRGLALPAGVIAVAIDSTRASAMPAALVGSTIKNAMTLATGLGAGSVPASIVSLSQGVSRSMLITKLGMISVTAFGLGAAATGVVALAPRSAQQQPAPDLRALAPDRIVASAPPQKTPDEESPRETDLIVRSASNLSRIAKAVHAYLDANKSDFPAAAIVSQAGTPLLSWRVAILPYLGEREKALYVQFKLAEPWDSVHNRALLAKMPKVYAPLASKEGANGVTHYQALVGGGALFEADQTVNIKMVTDGTSNTLMLAEALAPVPWTKPEDVSVAEGNPLSKLGGQFKDGFVVATADGFPRFMKKSIDPFLFTSMITRGGGEVVELSKAGEGIHVPQ
jgi:RNA polymerase sigma factor (sigma-70 family)